MDYNLNLPVKKEVLMKLKLYSFLIASLLIMVIGCKTASKLYQKGDYDGAVMLAVKELQKKPGDPERIALVQSAYTFAINDQRYTSWYLFCPSAAPSKPSCKTVNFVNPFSAHNL